ncbi:MAG: alpha-glucosidase C-terminal domain-containing protein [Ignavibacteriales bacterium]|nr:alpha-glucosidase C-terminal domain-containing protein [Ignavibacteriales bacterium]
MSKKIIYLFPLIFILVHNCQQKIDIKRVPQWASEAVWYQIFPERFNNGDKNNDPKPIDLAGGWPYNIPEGWQNHPWTSDWYKLQPWENNGHDFYWNAGVRRYGGDLQGVINKLDYLQNLGITAIYLNPVFESPSLHKYDASSYHHIDNNFGPDPEKDRQIWSEENPIDPTTWQWTTADKLFLELIKEAHNRNIRVIIDGVFNHVGNTFWAFKDLIEKQEKSQFKDWFSIKSFDDPNTPENEFDYEGWYGVKDLPEIKEDENGLVEGAANHVHDVVKRWMDPNQDGDPSDGIDGWRLDVAEMVKHKFWQKFRTWVKEINPEAYITGEIWWKDWPNNVMMNASPWLQGDQFDAVMNYRFTRAVKHFVSDQKNKISASAFADTINFIRKDYNKENLYVLMNLLGSHDTERLASLIVNPDYWYDHNANPAQRETFDVRKPNEIERMKQKLMVGIQMTMPGAPMVYYGDEAGMWGGDDPDCRKPMVWPDLIYETEATHPFGKQRSIDEVKFDTALFDWYKNIIKIRKSNDVLHKGDLNFIQSNDIDVLIFERQSNDSKIIVIANSSSEEKNIELNFGESSYKNLINGNEFKSGINNILLKQFEIVVLKKN